MLVHGIHATFVILVSCVLLVCAKIPPVKITSAYYKNGVFHGTIAVKTNRYDKLVQIVYSDTNGNDTTPQFNTINATYATPLTSTGTEIWQFQSTIPPTTKTYIARLMTRGKTFVDDGDDSVGYPLPIVPDDLPGCSSWYVEDDCIGDATEYPDTYTQLQWQTPPRGSPNWYESYQDQSKLTAYADVVYNADRNAATIHVIAQTNPSTMTVLYRWNGGPWTRRSSLRVTVGVTTRVMVSVFTPESPGKIDLDPVFLIWNTPAIKQRQDTRKGQKGAIVELWGWPYTDIAKECVFLGKAGYMGVKIWPPNESMTSNQWLTPFGGQLNPWYFDYMPVSYKLTKTRHGTLDELKQMIDTCRANGVRVYVDAVINHMGPSSDDRQDHRQQFGDFCGKYGNKSSLAGSPYYQPANTYQYNNYTRQRPTIEFPSVPYGPTDFHCRRSMDSSTTFGLQYGWLLGLSDLDTSKTYVQNRIATYLVSMISLGVSGYRVDAAKHISPADHTAILSAVKSRLGGSLPRDFITWLEIAIDYSNIDLDRRLWACVPGEYNFYTSFNDRLTRAGFTREEINQIKIWSSDYPLRAPLCGTWVIPADRFVIQNDDHDMAAGTSGRYLGDQGTVLQLERNVTKHRAVEVRLFTRTDNNWQIRALLSGFNFGWSKDGDVFGYPDGYSDCANYDGASGYAQYCRSVSYRPAHDPDSCGYDVYDADGQWVPGSWTRTHRDLTVVRAVRQFMGLSTNVTALDVGLPVHCKAK